MRKTLLISGHYPLPENIGINIRTMNFVNFFKNHGTVDIAYSCVFSGVQTGTTLFSNEYLLKIKDHKSFKKRLINGFIKGIPLPVYEFCEASHRLLRTVIEANEYDYIIVRYVYSTSLLFKLSTKYKKRIILDFDDILSGSLYESMLSSVKGSFKKFIMDINKRLLIKYEKKCLNLGRSLFCSEKDRALFLINNEGSNTFVVPNIYSNKSLEDYNFGDGFGNGHILLFVGALGYGPNIKGLKWFIESIFPDFKKKYPDAKLLVIGHTPPDDIKDLCQSRKGIELYGDVPDINEYYKGCKAMIVPLLSGGGTRIKILEAALANRPVLSTPIGAEGLDFTDGTDLLLFNNSNDFCTQYKNLLDEKNYHSLIHNARNLVLSRYSIQNFNNAMEEVIRNF